jgi:hypothetical protein
VSRHNFAKAKHLMVDIETLSTEISAKVLQIAAVEFSADEIGDEKVWNLNITDRHQRYRTVNPKTLEWWMSLPEATRALVFVPEEQKLPASTVIDELRPMIEAADYVWARGPSFDLEIINHLVDGLNSGEMFLDGLGDDEEGPKKFIPWFKWRDERPLRDMLNALGVHPQANPNRVPHYALDDVNEQIECVLRAWDLMSEGRAVVGKREA